MCSKMLRVGYAIGTPLIVLALIFNHQVLGIYSTNPLLINNAFWPYIVGISVFFPGLPGFIYLNAVSGTGNTRMAFAFQMVTIILYMIYLWILSSFLDAPLAVYSAIEHLFVISLLIMSCSYMKKWSKAVIGKE
mgnify:CR=1 FL=1